MFRSRAFPLAGQKLGEHLDDAFRGVHDRGEAHFALAQCLARAHWGNLQPNSIVEEDAGCMTRRIAGLRVFEDPESRSNLSVAKTGGAVLLASQYALLSMPYAWVRVGIRHSHRRGHYAR